MRNQSSHLLGILLLVLAGSSAALLLVALVDPAGVFAGFAAAPGRVLFGALHHLAWWVPLFLTILSGLAFSRRAVTWRSVVLLGALHVPVLTAAVMVRLINQGPAGGETAPLIVLLVDAFSPRGALLVVSLTLALQAGLYIQLWRMVVRTGKTAGNAVDERENWASRNLPVLALPEPETETQADAPEYLQDISHETTEEGTLEASEPLTLEELRRRMEPDEYYDDEHDDIIAEEEIAAEETAEETEDAPLVFMLRTRNRYVENGVPSSPLSRENPVDLHDTEDLDYQDDEYDDGDLDYHHHDVSYHDEEVLMSVDFPEDILEEEELEDMDFPEEAAVSVPDTPRPPRKRGKKYTIPVNGILMQYSDGRYWEIDDGTRDAAEVLRVTLEEFGIRAEVTGIRKGPVITMFEILPAPGVKLTRITNLADNIALRLAASSVRIVAPIPGKHAVGIEIPNRERHLVSFAELLQDEDFFGDRQEIPIALGKNISGEAQIMDLARTPHLLIAGATGSGKSVCVNSIISSILYRRSPQEVKMILIDPKIVELKFYNDIPHLLTPVITDPKRAFQALQYLIYEMERRYSLLDSMGARDISGFNSRIKRKNMATEPLPYIVVIIDEFADLMSTSGKELESTVARLAAMSRAVGIHLVLATQRPSTDVITGLIKANIPARIAFMVASKVDSRIILDAMGADKLLGRGDMLFTSASDPFPIRMQGAFLSEDEVERIVEAVKEYGEPDYIDDEIFIEDEDDDLDTDVLEDPLMERAIEVVNTSRKASASYLQRRLKIGYNRAARMVEEMERMGIVGPQNGSKPREVISSGM